MIADDIRCHDSHMGYTLYRHIYNTMTHKDCLFMMQIAHNLLGTLSYDWFSRDFLIYIFVIISFELYFWFRGRCA